MNRRGFLIATTAALAAPAIVRASSLMPIAAPKLILPPNMLFTLGWKPSLVIVKRRDGGPITTVPSEFFDIVTWTGDGRELRTLPHSVIWRPELRLIKARNKP